MKRAILGLIEIYTFDTPKQRSYICLIREDKKISGIIFRYANFKSNFFCGNKLVFYHLYHEDGKTYFFINPIFDIGTVAYSITVLDLIQICEQY